jgi:tetratricopeptide (TPR) repeat protein
MGTVYLAERHDGEIQQRVAVKLLVDGGTRPAWQERFLKERRLLASLNHPSIVHVIDAGHTAAGQPYLVMEYVEGIPIDTYAAQIELREQLRLFLRVCEGVSHAHRHLIIHRDLKPSNILVDSSGQPKLLDFGIAKLLDETGEPTQTVERMLTPNYASPEQFLGKNQTTATDVYSLGAVLYKLLTGRSPHETGASSASALEVIAGARQIPPPTRLNAALPTDLDYILRKALRTEPEERYASVEAFGNDIRALQEWRPVEARSGDVWYRTRRFLRRYWIPATAAAITIIGLSVGISIANYERAAAQRRFAQVRRLANKVLDLDSLIQGLPGSTKARNEIVAMSQEYLEGLRSEAFRDKELAVETGIAYIRLASAQGLPTAPNLGQSIQAEQSLRNAEALLDSVVTASPQNRQALLALAEVAEGRMDLAEDRNQRDEALAQARQAVARLDALTGLGNPSESEKNKAAELFANIALMFKNSHLYTESVRYARRSIELSPSGPEGAGTVAFELSVIADSLRLSGDLEGALEAIRQAVSTLKKASFQFEDVRRATVIAVLWREGVILGKDGDLSLGRSAEAVQVLQREYDIAEEGVKADADDSLFRLRMATAARELGAILRHSDPRRALEVYDHALFRLREIKGNNVKARADEVRLLAGSSYALRSLRRIPEAQQRIDAGFRRLQELKYYPAARIKPDDEAYVALRAQGDQYAETGQPKKAAETYQELLDKLLAAKPDTENDLSQAVKLSNVYDALARVRRQTGENAPASELFARRLALWRHWDGKLPSNPFVRGQLEAASRP